MTIFVTNIWNHYTTTIGEPMARLLGEDNFRLVLVSPVQEEPEFKSRREMGWKFELPKYMWLVPNPQTAEELAHGEAIRLIEQSEVAVIGALYGCKRLFRAVRRRVRSGKTTFFTNERFFKEPVTLKWMMKPRNAYNLLYQAWLASHKNVYYLPISHWGKTDWEFLGGAADRVFKWAYMPQISEKPTEKKAHDKFRIGWCGRMLKWKHPEHILQAVALLPKEYQERCEVSLVGDGECKGTLLRMAAELKIEGITKFMPYMPVKKVTAWMMGLDAYVFPSDRGEGWGVVLAEAMDRNCVPIACVEAGATLDLISDGENGFVFERGDINRIARKLQWLMERPVETQLMGLEAWRSMQSRAPEKWARRLVDYIGKVHR